VYTSAKPVVPDPSKLKNCKSTHSHHILVETIKAEGETFVSEIHKFINSVWQKEELPDQ
jgi:hypothetical protein